MIAIVVHGGAGGTSRAAQRGCRQAAEIGMEILRKGGSALDASVAAVEWMENSGNFNAGTGSVLRMDRSIQMDAAVAVAHGSLVTQGAVEVVEDVQNPVLLAVEVLKTPHVKIAGDGAVQLARRLGLPGHPGPSRLALQRHQRLLKAIERGELDTAAPGWTPEALAQFFGEGDIESGSGSLVSVEKECDTVGAIAFDRVDRVATAASTGGMSIMLPGRVGDVTARGAGFEIGSLGGVLSTGIGEEIIRLQGAGSVFQFIQRGVLPQLACELTVQLFGQNIPVGFIALTKDGVGIASNRDMPSHSIVEE